MNRTQYGIRSAQVGVLANAILALAKIITGVLGHSYALIADGVESATDIFSSLVVWRGLQVAARAPDESHPFGYGKAEAVSGGVVALMLLGAAGVIAIQAVREILTPHHMPAWFTLVVLIVVVVTKEVLYRWVFSVGEEVDSVAVRTDAWHHRSDALTSLAAFVGISIALWGGAGWASADDYAAMLASGVILYNGVRLLRPVVDELMDRAPEAGFVARVAAVAGGIAGVLGTEKVLARRVGAQYRVVLHVQADPRLSLRAAHQLGGQVRSRVIAVMPAVVDVLIHMEPFDEGGGNV